MTASLVMPYWKLEITQFKNKLNDLGIKIKGKESEIALKNAQIKSIEKVLNDRITALEDKFEKMVEKLEKTRNENESLRKNNSYSRNQTCEQRKR